MCAHCTYWWAYVVEVETSAYVHGNGFDFSTLVIVYLPACRIVAERAFFIMVMKIDHCTQKSTTTKFQNNFQYLQNQDM